MNLLFPAFNVCVCVCVCVCVGGGGGGGGATRTEQVTATSSAILLAQHMTVQNNTPKTL